MFCALDKGTVLNSCSVSCLVLLYFSICECEFERTMCMSIVHVNCACDCVSNIRQLFFPLPEIAYAFIFATFKHGCVVLSLDAVRALKPLVEKCLVYTVDHVFFDLSVDLLCLRRR